MAGGWAQGLISAPKPSGRRRPRFGDKLGPFWGQAGGVEGTSCARFGDKLAALRGQAPHLVSKGIKHLHQLCAWRPLGRTRMEGG